MRRGLLTVALLIVLAAAVLWKPAIEPVQKAAPEQIAEPLEAPAMTDEPEVAAADVVDASVAMDAGELDAGVAHVVEIEMFEHDSDLHAVGVELTFTLGRRVGHTRTNMMGFATVELEPGTYFVEPRSDPRWVLIEAATQRLTLHLAHPPEPHEVKVVVVDELGRPARATVSMADRPSSEVHVFGDEHAGATDSSGHFSAATTKDEVWLRANGSHRVSPWVHVNVPGPEVKLHLARGVAWIALAFDGPVGASAVEYECRGDVTPLYLGTTDVEQEVTPGHLTVRARGVRGKNVFIGETQVEVKAGDHAHVAVAMNAVPGLRVRVVNEWGHAVQSAPVRVFETAEHSARSYEQHATKELGVISPASERTPSQFRHEIFRADTDARGEIEVIPNGLSQYDPLYAIEVSSGWRNTRETFAKLEDEPVTLVVRAFNAALDSTDAGNPVAWGGDR